MTKGREVFLKDKNFVSNRQANSGRTWWNSSPRRC